MHKYNTHTRSQKNINTEDVDASVGIHYKVHTVTMNVILTSKIVAIHFTSLNLLKGSHIDRLNVVFQITNLIFQIFRGNFIIFHHTINL